MSDIIDRSTTTIMGILIAVVLVCSALIPISMDQIKQMMTTFTTEHGYSLDIVNMVSQYQSIIFIVILLVIIALIIGVVKTYTSGNERD